MDDQFILVEICSYVVKSFDKNSFNKIFEPYTDLFWDFWIKNAEGYKITYFYNNLEYIGNHIGKSLKAKEKFAHMVNEITEQVIAKYGYKLVKILPDDKQSK